MSFSMLYFSKACVEQSTASCCMSSDISAFFITALRSDIFSNWKEKINVNSVQVLRFYIEKFEKNLLYFGILFYFVLKKILIKVESEKKTLIFIRSKTHTIFIYFFQSNNHQSDRKTNTHTTEKGFFFLFSFCFLGCNYAILKNFNFKATNWKERIWLVQRFRVKFQIHNFFALARFLAIFYELKLKTHTNINNFRVIWCLAWFNYTEFVFFLKYSTISFLYSW